MVWTKLGKERLRKSQPKKPSLTKRHYLTSGGAVLLAGALASGAVAKWGHSTDAVTVPELTRINVVLDQAVSTSAKPGHHFRATVSKPVLIEGKAVIPKGAHVEGVVVEAKEAARFKGRPQLLLALQSVDVDGQNYPVQTYSSRELGPSHMKHHLLWIGGGAAGGVLIGAVAGGGTGAAIGGPVGAAAGATLALVTAKRDVKLRPETSLSFRLSKSATINVKS